MYLISEIQALTAPADQPVNIYKHIKMKLEISTLCMISLAMYTCNYCMSIRPPPQDCLVPGAGFI